MGLHHVLCVYYLICQTYSGLFHSIYLPSSTPLSLHLSIFLPIYLSTYLSIYLSNYLSNYFSIYLSIHLPIYLSTYSSIYIRIYLSIHLSIYQSIYQSIYLTLFQPPSIFLPFSLSLSLSVSLLSLFLTNSSCLLFCHTPSLSLFLPSQNMVRHAPDSEVTAAAGTNKETNMLPCAFFFFVALPSINILLNYFNSIFSLDSMKF